MSKQDQPLLDNQGNPVPSLDVIMNDWLSSIEAAQIANMSQRGMLNACQQGRIRAIKIGSKRRGEWFIDPAAALAFERDKKQPRDPSQND